MVIAAGGGGGGGHDQPRGTCPDQRTGTKQRDAGYQRPRCPYLRRLHLAADMTTNTTQATCRAAVAFYRGKSFGYNARVWQTEKQTAVCLTATLRY